MFKQVLTLFRGAAHDMSEDFSDRNALPLLRQQIRESAAALQTAQKSVALAMAQNEIEEKQYSKIAQKIEDLEVRTMAALEQGKDKLAQEAAETISALENERDTSRAALDISAGEIDRLKKIIRRSGRKLKELDRGYRLSVATEHTRSLRKSVPGNGLSTINEASATLQRLRSRQKLDDRSSELVHELAASGDPDSMSEKLAGAGCGEALESSTDDVLARLKEKLEKRKSPETVKKTA